MNSPQGTPLTRSQRAEVAALERVIAQLDEVRTAAQRSSTYGFAEPWPVFARRMRLLTPQSYGVRLQNYLAARFGWTVVSAREDKGDVVDRGGRYWEVKATFITASNPGVNFVQIRPHQNIAGYHLFVVEEDYTLVHLTLTKAQMAAELSPPCDCVEVKSGHDPVEETAWLSGDR